MLMFNMSCCYKRTLYVHLVIIIRSLLTDSFSHLFQCTFTRLKLILLIKAQTCIILPYPILPGNH